jgi:hypothetical protein
VTDADRLEALRAEARHARERHDLYKARVYASRPTTLTRLRELERARDAAEARLRHAERELASGE